MHQILFFTNNCIIIFYTLYLLKFNCVKCVLNNRNTYSLEFPSIDKGLNRNSKYIKSPNASNILNKRSGSKLCIINKDFISLKPVQISVNTFWRKESQFNSNFTIDANLNDTFENVKQVIHKKTGIPAQLQRLYINTGNANMNDSDSTIDENKFIKVDNSDKLNKYLNHFKVSKSKELELNILLELPAPVYKSINPEPSRLEEYISGLIRYTELLNNIGNINAGNNKSKSACNGLNMNTSLKDPINYFSNLSFNGSKSTDSGNTSVENDVKTNNDVNVYNNTVVKKVYIRIFEDFPPDTHMFNKRLRYIINYYFPINTSATIKFTAFCLLFKLNKAYNKVILDAFTVLPLIAVILQTRPGIFLNKLLFHLIANQRVPQLVYNLLPAHLAQKFRSNRT